MNTEIEQIMGLLKRGCKVAVSAHVNPDGDAVGSCFALALALKKIEITPYVLLEKYNEKFNIIPGKEFLYKGSYKDIQPDIFIALDCADKNRLASAIEVFERTPVTVNIDHHVSNLGFAQYNYIEAEASSTSEIVFGMVNAYVPLDTDIASAIYSGIIYDTGGFRHGCTSVKTHNITAELLRLNVPFTELYDELLYEHSYEEARGLGLALSNLVRVEGYPIIYSVISHEQMKQNKTSSSDYDGIVEYILNIKGNEVSIFAYAKNEKEVKISLRSKALDVSEIAGQFGGGGHVLAAGCTISDTVSNAVERILKEVKGRLS